MFKFLKDKLKAAVSKIATKAEETEEKQVEEIKEEKLEIQEELKEEPKTGLKEEKTKKKSLISKISEKVTSKKITEDEFNDLFYDLEIALLENNVAYEVIDRIKSDLSKELVDKPISRTKLKETILNTLKSTLADILTTPELNLVDFVKSKDKPAVILFFGYNGVGKSLTVSKIGKYLNDHKLKVLLAAGDTFRAAGATQLEEYGKRTGLKVISQKQGSDSCALIFDAISSAKSKNLDVVLGDTAGRIPNNKDLLRELQKIVRVTKPNLKVLVIDALTGSDIVSQVEEFNKEIGIDALVITKVDAYEKGGSILSAAFLLKKPILFLGTGQKDQDLKIYTPNLVLDNIGF